MLLKLQISNLMILRMGMLNAWNYHKRAFFSLGFPVLKEMLIKIKSLSPFEKFKTQILKHTEMDLDLLRFCLQSCYIWYNKCYLKKAEIKLNQRVFREYILVFQNIIILYLYF